MDDVEILLSEKQEKTLEELCISNGVNYDKLKDGSGNTVKRLEMFFSGFPEIVGMSYFPGLVALCLVGQDTLSEIKGLETLVHLEELWICEASLKEICGLDNCKRLKRLYLYDNAISKIDNLFMLKALEVIWLNDNKIEFIEGLDCLSNLKEINFSNNKISQIGNSFEKLSRLEILHISGNQIRSLKDFNNLIQLRSLHTLSLKDPVYGSNPVATVCNYSTYIFYHLPQIKRLDGFDVDNESSKGLAMTTVRKKKMYYNMRVKTLERSTTNLLEQINVEKLRLQESPSSRIRNVTNILKTLERELETTSIDKSENAATSDIYSDIDVQNENYQQLVQAKLGNFKDRVGELESICDEIDQCSFESRVQVENISESTIKRLLLELETGGNVRFEDGTTNDVWYTSCHDLVLSRFCASDFKEYDITGIKIHRITRVHNRVLRVAFDEKVSSFLAKIEESDGGDQKDLYASSIEYLFTSWTTALKPKDGFLRLLEGGCEEIAENGDGRIRLSNNVFNSDCKRLEISKRQAEEDVDLFPYRHGQLVIAKVFVGDTELSKKDESKSPFNIREANSTPGPCMANNETMDHEFRPFSKVSEPSCDCRTKQCDWTVYDRDLVLPEYVVDFEYLTKMKPLSPLICYYGMTSSDGDDIPDDDVTEPDSDILDMEPIVQPKPRLLELTEDILLKYCSVESTKNITTLNLHDCGLTRLKNINHLANLKKLVVSFNGLTKLDDITSMPNLSSVDASFNSLTTLDGIKACPVLAGLDVSWNKLRHIRDEIGTLRKHVTSLTSLNTRHNPWHRADNFRTYTIGRLRTLQVLDGQYITEQEHALALRQAASSRITSFTILAHSRTDDERLRSLSLAPTAAVLWKYSKNKPMVLDEDDMKWMKNVTTLHLDGQGISKLSNLEKLTHLKWASFSDNNINRIEGLEACTKLEELTVARNCISKIDGISKLTNLKRLDLAYNDITTLDVNTMEYLTNLEYLSVECNSIVTMQGLKKCSCLQEVFAGNNQVLNTREIFYLKGLENLDILDLSGNPMASSNENHRLFVIYHLSSLKAFNGVAVTSAERSSAQETLGGRMTMDFVAERLGHANFSELQEIDLPHCDLRTIDVGNGEVFRNLRSINLERNNLTSFGGLIHLVNLKVLCLNYNKIDCVFPKRKTTSPSNKKGSSVIRSSDDVTSPQCFTPVLEKLEVLHLGYNGISNLKGLQLSRIPNIKALFLQGNEISKVEGIQGLQELRELVLDQNKIKTLSETSFIGQRRLQELHIEDNRLRDLSNFEPLVNLQRLYLGMNKIQELSELQKLERMTNLFEISLISNPITRRLTHRPILVFRQPNILCIDGIPVTNDERAKAEVYLMDHQLSSMVNPEGTESNLPNLQTKSQAPLKVTTVQLSSSTENGWSIGHKFGQVEFVESLSSHPRYNERNDPRAKLRASNSYPPQHIPSSYDVMRHGRHQPPTTSSMHLTKPQGQLPNSGSYVLRGNSNSNFPQPPKPK